MSRARSRTSRDAPDSFLFGALLGIPLEALTTFPYDGRVVTRGQSFTARSASDAKVLTLLKKAKPASKTYKTAAVAVEAEQPEGSPAEPIEAPKRRYRRRDLVAEPE